MREGILMQIGIVVSGFQSQTVPPVRIQIAHRMHAARRKAEQPVSGRVGRDMCLKQTAQLKRVHDIAVCALAGERVAPVERAFVLIDQHAVLVERLVAVAVELHREQTLARAERVGRVDDDKVVLVLNPADIL